jgi:hypothetical protein
VFKLGEFVDLLNDVSRSRADGRPRWDRWNVRRMLAAAGVEALPRVPGGDLSYTLRALQRALPDLYDSILDCSALQDSAAA